MKRLLSLLLTLALLATVTACTKQEERKQDDPKPAVEGTEKKEAPEAKEAEKKEEAAEPANFLASEKPLELSIFYFLHEPYKDDNAVMKKAAELTNISLTGYVSQSSSSNKEAFTLMAASGKLADIVCWDNSQIRGELAQQGAFLALDELMEHAPHIKAFLDANPAIKNHVTATDGHIYSIPYIPDGDAAQGWYIRKDWLDKLGLKEPTNAQELHDVLLAFKEKDPNGNGKADEIPYFNRDGSPKTVFADFAQLWGAKELWYEENGKVKYGPYEPAYKEAYKNLAQWYKEGLIDQEIYTRGKTARDVLLKENLGGMTHDWFASTSKYNSNEGMPEGFNFAVIAPPADKDGKVYERTIRSKLHWCGWGIAASNPDPVATMKYFDFFFTEEGRRLSNFGVEGETYTMANGKPVFKEEILTNGDPVVNLRGFGCQMTIGVQQDFEYEKQLMNKDALAGVQMYVDNNYFGPQFPTLQYTEEENARLSELMTAIDTLKVETAQKWVLGSEDVESGYEAFKSALEKFGMEEAIQIQQAAYDRYMKNMAK